jgi:hypothetical protein
LISPQYPIPPTPVDNPPVAHIVFGPPETIEVPPFAPADPTVTVKLNGDAQFTAPSHQEKPPPAPPEFTQELILPDDPAPIVPYAI